MRGSVSDVIRCLARGWRAADVRLRPQHLEDHDRLVDARRQRGPVGDVVGARAARATVGRGAGDDQLALARAQLARGGDERGAAPASATVTALGEVDDQPAHAAGERGVDAAGASSPTVAASSVPADLELVDDVVEPLLADGERARLDHGRRDCEVNMALDGAQYGCSRLPRAMPVPLFDTQDAARAAARRAARQARRGARRRPLHPRARRSRPSRQELAALPRRAARGRRRQRHGRARARAARAWASGRATTSSCPRSRSTPPPRRSRVIGARPRVLRRRPARRSASRPRPSARRSRRARRR